MQGLPLTGGSFVISFEVKGRPPVPPSQQPSMQIRVATPGYFDAIGIPLKRGRFFTDDDREGSSRVVLITERAARVYFPGRIRSVRPSRSAGGAERERRAPVERSSESSAT